MRTTRRFVPALAAALVLAACGGDAEVAEEPVEGLEPAEPVAEAPTVAAPAAGGLGEWDTDRDLSLNQEEFGAYSRDRVYTRWAGDTPGVDRDEWGTGVLGAWDRDSDMRVSEAEFTENRGWFGDRDPGAFGDWDANEDTFLDAGELGQGFERTGVFGDWDLNDNATLEENEFGEGLFGLGDANDNAMLEENEWGSTFGAWEL